MRGVTIIYLLNIALALNLRMEDGTIEERAPLSPPRRGSASPQGVRVQVNNLRIDTTTPEVMQPPQALTMSSILNCGSNRRIEAMEEANRITQEALDAATAGHNWMQAQQTGADVPKIEQSEDEVAIEMGEQESNVITNKFGIVEVDENGLETPDLLGGWIFQATRHIDIEKSGSDLVRRSHLRQAVSEVYLAILRYVSVHTRDTPVCNAFLHDKNPFPKVESPKLSPQFRECQIISPNPKPSQVPDCPKGTPVCLEVELAFAERKSSILARLRKDEESFPPLVMKVKAITTENGENPICEGIPQVLLDGLEIPMPPGFSERFERRWLLFTSILRKHHADYLKANEMEEMEEICQQRAWDIIGPEKKPQLFFRFPYPFECPICCEPLIPEGEVIGLRMVECYLHKCQGSVYHGHCMNAFLQQQQRSYQNYFCPTCRHDISETAAESLKLPPNFLGRRRQTPLPPLIQARPPAAVGVQAAAEERPRLDAYEMCVNGPIMKWAMGIMAVIIILALIASFTTM